jgi:DNA-binding LacI/PurR family transcriptional regulator
MAGVSPTVVSRVLHNKATAIRVSEQTAERVRQAASDLGYRFNILARQFRQQRTMAIGVLHGLSDSRPNFGGDSSYFADLMDGVIDAAFALDYTVAFCPKLLGDSPAMAMADGRFDGLVWYGSTPTEENRKLVMESTVPIVLLHNPSEVFGNRFPSVICDNTQGVDLAVEHLAGLGHRRIAVAVSREDFFNEARTRIECFFKAMRVRGLRSGPSDVIEFGLDLREIHQFFEAGPAHTAVFAVTDTIASRFLDIAPEHGFAVPTDLSVVGFDSTRMCEALTPRLTSVHQPLALMGRRAVEMLNQSIEKGATDPVTLVIPCSFDIRGSTSIATRGI